MRVGTLAISLMACTEAPGTLVAEAGPDQIIEVGETLTLDGSDSTGATYWNWTFGDGEHERLTQSTTRHRWMEPGRYTVYLEIADDLGRTDTDSLQLTVHHPVLDPAPGRPPLWWPIQRAILCVRAPVGCGPNGRH